MEVKEEVKMDKCIVPFNSPFNSLFNFPFNSLRLLPFKPSKL